MIRNCKWLVTALSALWLSACAETSFQNALGLGKDAPDESKVRTVQPLAVPPDLQLRPPAASDADSRMAETDDAGADTGSGALAMPPARSQRATAPTGTSTRRLASAEAGNAKSDKSGSSGDFYDIYRKYGISLYDEEGRRKSITRLNIELGRKIKEERRKKNPRYGTIFNIGSIWKK